MSCTKFYINHTKSVLISEENDYVNFQNFKRLTKAPFIIYCDFEGDLILSTDHIDFDPNIRKYQNHIFFSYGYKLICVDVVNRYSKGHKTDFGGDAIDKF